MASDIVCPSPPAPPHTVSPPEEVWEIFQKHKLDCVTLLHTYRGVANIPPVASKTPLVGLPPSLSCLLHYSGLDTPHFWLAIPSVGSSMPRPPPGLPVPVLRVLLTKVFLDTHRKTLPHPPLFPLKPASLCFYHWNCCVHSASVYEDGNLTRAGTLSVQFTLYPHSRSLIVMYWIKERRKGIQGLSYTKMHRKFC